MKNGGGGGDEGWWFQVEGTAQAKARRGETAYRAHSREFWLPVAGAQEGELAQQMLVCKS